MPETLLLPTALLALGQVIACVALLLSVRRA